MAKDPKIIRTPTKLAGPITPEEEKALAAHAQKWIDIALRTDRIDPDKIIPAIKGMYKVAGLKEPAVVIVPSPLVMAFAYGAAAAACHEKNVDLTPEFIAKDIAKSIGDNPEKDAAAACKRIAGKAGLEWASKWRNVYQGGNMWASYDSYLTAFRDVLGLRLPQYEPYKFWEEAAMHGGFRVVHPEFCFVCDFPEILRRDQQNRPHGENGPSHRWRDGWELYHWHGVRIPAEWIKDKENLSAQTALTWRNIEQRRAACEIVGWARILRDLKSKTIDRDEDPMIGELVEVQIEGNRERFLKVLCGTGREFALPVPPEMRTALQANAWTFGMEDAASFIPPEVRT